MLATFVFVGEDPKLGFRKSFGVFDDAGVNEGNTGKDNDFWFVLVSDCNADLVSVVKTGLDLSRKETPVLDLATVTSLQTVPVLF